MSPDRQADASPSTPLSPQSLSLPAMARTTAIAALLSLPLSLGYFMSSSEDVATLVLGVLEARSFFVNLACLAGAAMLAHGLYDLARDPSYAPMGRRITISLFSGVVVSAVAIGTMLPPSPSSATLSLLSACGAGLLCAQLAGAAMRSTRETVLRLSLFAAILSVLVGLAAFLIERQPLLAEMLGGLSRAVTASAEALWLLAPIPMLTDTRVATERIRLGRAVAGWLVALVALAPILMLLSLRHETLAGFLRFTSNVGALSGSRLVLVYPAFLLMIGSLSMVQLVQRDPFRAHVGAAGLLWLAAGASVRTPLRALCVVLFFLLLGRVARATKDVFGPRTSAPPPDAGKPASATLH